jgi:hypothetical protein
MNISLGFFVVVVLILFPGLIFRRLFFYGEFSKEFKAGHNLITLLAISTVPGLVILVLTFVTYSYLFVAIDIGEVIDKFKDLSSPDFRLTNSEDTPVNELLNYKAAPFLGFLYLTSVILGSLSGRLIRISHLDTKLKLLRFKNYWFYLLNGQQFEFKKLRHLKESNKRHVFTKADVLIDSNSKTHLYSGIVVDYELSDNDCTSLNKIMLQNAERYSLKEGKRVPVEIPGNLLIVDCQNLKNINLTYVFEESKSVLQSKIPTTIELVFSYLFILLLPIFIFRAERINWEVYSWYFSLPWYSKIFSFFAVIQAVSLFNPFVKRKDDFTFVTIKLFLGKLVWVIFWILLVWLL